MNKCNPNLAGYFIAESAGEPSIPNILVDEKFETFDLKKVSSIKDQRNYLSTDLSHFKFITNFIDADNTAYYLDPATTTT